MAKVILALIAALSITSPASADVYGAINIASHHTAGEYEEFNPGLAIGYQGKTLGSEIGFYRNSYGDHTNYVLAHWTTDTAIRAGVFLGIADGYSKDVHSFGDLMPLVGLQVTAGIVQVRAAPIKGGAAFGLQLRFNLSE